MYIFRWLMKHPVIILALYFLSIAAILFSMTGGGSLDKNTDATETVQVLKTESMEVGLSDAPAIEPPALITTLVLGDSLAEQTTTEEVSKLAEVVEAPESSEVMAVASIDSENNETEVAAQFKQMNANELLLMAREAYWNNGLEESAQIYQQLIKLNAEVIDYKGELGNVYWRQGFPKKAAALYAEISLPMIKEGNVDRVANMVGFIGLYFPEKATHIHNMLQANK